MLAASIFLLNCFMISISYFIFFCNFIFLCSILFVHVLTLFISVFNGIGEYFSKILCCFLEITFLLKPSFKPPFFVVSIFGWITNLCFSMTIYFFLSCFKPVVRFCWILFTSDKIYVSGVQANLLVPLFCFTSIKLIKGFSLLSCKRKERNHWEPVVEVIFEVSEERDGGREEGPFSEDHHQYSLGVYQELEDAFDHLVLLWRLPWRLGHSQFPKTYRNEQN